MTTTYKTKTDKTYKFVTEKLSVGGLSLLVYKNSEDHPEIFALDLFDEKEFHINLREKIKNEVEIILNESTNLE